MNKRTLLMLIALWLAGEAGAWAVTSPLIVDPADNVPPLKGRGDVPPLKAQPTAPAPAAEAKPEPMLSGNPLWAIPLRSLSATTARPLFAPSRRPIMPAVATVNRAPLPVAAPKPAEPEKPTLSLVGTIAGSDTGIGVFIDTNAKNVVRLRTGEKHNGWMLRAVQRREVMFEKGLETTVLTLPPPEMKQAAAAAPGMAAPANAPQGNQPIPVAFTPPGASPAPAGIQPPALTRAAPPTNPFTQVWDKQMRAAPPRGTTPAVPLR
jgi:general secretion pathway protein N